MPSVIMKICKKYMNDYKIVAVKSKQLTIESTKQSYYMVNRQDKLELLSRVLDMEKDFY
jgi:ATP-dependent RNA helicase DeaD